MDFKELFRVDIQLDDWGPDIFHREQYRGVLSTKNGMRLLYAAGGTPQQIKDVFADELIKNAANISPSSERRLIKEAMKNERYCYADNLGKKDEEISILENREPLLCMLVSFIGFIAGMLIGRI